MNTWRIVVISSNQWSFHFLSVISSQHQKNQNISLFCVIHHLFFSVPTFNILVNAVFPLLYYYYYYYFIILFLTHFFTKKFQNDWSNHDFFFPPSLLLCIIVFSALKTIRIFLIDMLSSCSYDVNTRTVFKKNTRSA